MTNPKVYGMTEIVRPVDNCSYAHPEDGFCAHPKNHTPECHCAACPLIFAEPCGRGCAACPTEGIA